MVRVGVRLTESTYFVGGTTEPCSGTSLLYTRLLTLNNDTERRVKFQTHYDRQPPVRACRGGGRDRGEPRSKPVARRYGGAARVLRAEPAGGRPCAMRLLNGSFARARARFSYSSPDSSPLRLILRVRMTAFARALNRYGRLRQPNGVGVGRAPRHAHGTTTSRRRVTPAKRGHTASADAHITFCPPVPLSVGAASV